jgi:F-type H+-transporting ATPase subunit epsilon
MSLHLEIVTPRGSVVDAEVAEVTLPGKLGEFGVLDGHIPFLSALKPGVVRYRPRAEGSGEAALRAERSDQRQGEGWKRLAIGTGYAEVGSARRVMVLTDQHARPEEIDAAETERELAEVEAKLKAWSGELTVEHQELVDRAAWAQARLDARRAAGN